MTDTPTIEIELADGIADGPPARPWSLCVAGDCFLPADGDGEPFVGPSLTDRIAEADVAVANLEAPVAPADADPIPKSGPVLRSHPDAPALLRESGFDLATLANNHVTDYGPAGLERTVAGCEAAGLATVGVGDDRVDAVEPAWFSPEPGTEVAVVNVCEREFNAAGDDGPGAAVDARPEAYEATAAAADAADAVIVVAHGGVEYVPFPPPQRRERLRRFVDSGADLVVGHHPHVAQGWERYDGTLVVHSLGNCYFGTHTDAESTRRGTVLSARFDGATAVAVELLPTRVDGGTVDRFRGDPAAEYASHLRRVASLTSDEQYRAYWQDVAMRLFDERYADHLTRGVRAGDAASSSDAETGRDRWVPTADRHDDPERRRAELLALLNVIRMDSHRWVVTEVLSVLTGDSPDLRTPAIEDEVAELLDWTRRECRR
ncbi:CapA family protein [Halosimplex amylolyticum]|uniref:CapA family protein n=1 Tax=Halosimplex amylolyticum TaxID=3396616 RepID=UPI003F562BC0